MTRRVATALEQDQAPMEIALAAINDAVEDAPDNDKEDLARAFFKEATGRFPVESSDRKAVYVFSLAVIAIIVVVTVVAATTMSIMGKDIPGELWALVTAIGTAIAGGLFGYARQ